MGDDRAESLLPPLREGLLPEARRIARDVLATLAGGADRARATRDLVAAMAEHGLLGRLFPSDLGGSARGRVTATELCVLREAIAAESPRADSTLAVQGLGSYPILLSGSDDLARRWIPPIARGRAVAAFALTEPGGGSDVGGMTTAAEPDGDGFRLSGEKTWISHAPDADVYVVFARTTPGAGTRGITAFVVPGDAPGLSGESLELINPHHIGRLTLDGVRVLAGDVVGTTDDGFRVAMRTLDRFRPSVGAAAVGMGQRALECARAYAAERAAFGRKVREFQAISHRLADSVTDLTAARLLVYEAAAAHDAGSRGLTGLAAMAKLFATEAAQRAVDVAVQVHGAVGLQEGHPVGELYREVRSLRIYEGTSEIQRNVIARELYRDA